MKPLREIKKPGGGGRCREGTPGMVNPSGREDQPVVTSRFSN